MYHVSAQGIDERMINVHYYYYYKNTAASRPQSTETKQTSKNKHKFMSNNVRPTNKFEYVIVSSVFNMPVTIFFLVIFINTCQQLQLFDDLILDQCGIKLEEGVHQSWA